MQEIALPPIVLSFMHNHHVSPELGYNTLFRLNIHNFFHWYLQVCKSFHDWSYRERCQDGCASWFNLAAILFVLSVFFCDISSFMVDRDLDYWRKCVETFITLMF